jgi:hypothetical protein
MAHVDLNLVRAGMAATRNTHEIQDTHELEDLLCCLGLISDS